jgi:two-component system chemotaxis response regulator CheB
MNKIKMLIVDDSAFMRSALAMMVRDEEDIEIVAQAKNGAEGVEFVKELNPDIITMDIEMPVMDGLTALNTIMKENPTPVLMVSSLTTEGADSTMKALSLGAVDFIPKEMSFVNVNITKIKGDLLAKIRHFAKKKSSLTKNIISHKLEIPKFEKKEKFIRYAPITETKLQESIDSRKERLDNLEKIVNKRSASSTSINSKYKLLVIGTSTGGPIALQNLIPKLPKNFPLPVVIVQHMPPNFTKSLAHRLNSASNMNVSEGTEGEILKRGNVYIAPGGKHLTILKEGGVFKLHTSDNPYGLFHKPSVDVMFKSVASFSKNNVLSVILTGMGKDGLEGAKELKKAGSYLIAEDESSCIVYGMPKAVIENKLADRILPLKQIHEEILSLV